MLRQGYAVASSSLNVFGNNCNDLLASETMMMVKERFIEAYGAPTLHDRLGLLGRVVSAAPDSGQLSRPPRRHHPVPHVPRCGVRHGPVITDARLLNRYFSVRQRRSVHRRAEAGGRRASSRWRRWWKVDKDGAGRIHVTEFCPPALPVGAPLPPDEQSKGRAVRRLRSHGQRVRPGSEDRVRPPAARQRRRAVRAAGAQCGPHHRRRSFSI